MCGFVYALGDAAAAAVPPRPYSTHGEPGAARIQPDTRYGLSNVNNVAVLQDLAVP